MKGVNILRFNQATAVQAMQEYWDKRRSAYAEKQKVISVSFSDQQFVVAVEEVPVILVADQANGVT